MLRRFFKDSAVYGLTGLLSRGVALLLLPFYTRVFSPADYGILDILLILAALVNLVVALEISQGVARYFPEEKTAEGRAGYASTALWFTVLAYSLFVAGVFGFAGRLSLWILSSAEFASLIRVAALATWGNGIFYLLQNQLRWELRAKAFAVASLAYTVISAAATVWLILGLGLGVSALFYGQLAGVGVGGSIAWYAARASFGLRFDVARCREMLRFAAPLVPSGIAVFTALYVDRLAISQLMTLADLGVYGVGYRLASVAGLLLLGFQGALTPLVYQHHKEPGTPRELSRIFRVFLAIVLPAALAMTIFAADLVRMVAPPDYYRAASVVPLLVLGALLHNMYIFAPGLSLAKRTQMIAGINAAAAVMNAALNYALIPLLGLSGAALATAASAFAAFLLHMLFSQRFYYVPHDWAAIGRAAGVTLAVGLFAVFGLNSTLPPTVTVLSGKLLLALAATSVLLYFLMGAEQLRLASRYLRMRFF